MEDLSRLVLLIWVLTLAVSGVSGILIASMGIGRVFLIYGIISAFCLWYLSLEMFESKGLTRREIVSQFCSKSSSKRRKS